MIISLGALFGAVGYLAKNKPVKIQQPQASPAAEPAKSVEDETADWKTYRNEEYGFEFKYPKTFNLGTNLILYDWTKEIVIGPGEFYYKTGQSRWKNRMVHRVNYTIGDLCISPEDIAPVTDYDLSQINCVIYQVDRNYVIKYSDPDSVDYILGLNKGEIVYTFNKANDFLFDQILSTFNFIK